ncbi:hypothetical protein CQW23_14646 [Capsicum baccatum]|uniref:cytokinin riboside 5'-monophosphate phosphoribohydrolase n=1 Tax=Capsicum baccatum TaxID=33114 RepID=A0A2G2WJS1_CAPBA|nr:hypothetical protein CQW23_14646 [Capsicum baccatum]
MGLISQPVHDGGRHVIGVIPKTLMPRELTGETVVEVKVVADMHQRKAEMARYFDAFIALPGGYSTLDELLEAISWAQLDIHDKSMEPDYNWIYQRNIDNRMGEAENEDADDEL